MGDKRNRIDSLINLIKQNNIEVNISKNYARGNKGFFLTNHNKFMRIDVAKNLLDDEVLSTLLHEFAHFIHFKFDKTMSNLDFLFENYNEEIEEELLKITVKKVPKEYASFIIKERDKLKNEIKEIKLKIKDSIKIYKNKKYHAPLCYFLKYEKIIFENKIYLLSNLKNDFTFINDEEYNYFKLLSKQRLLKKYNRRINKLNNYYCLKSELFARFVEAYFLDNDYTLKISPTASSIFERKMEEKNFSVLKDLQKIFVNLNISLIFSSLFLF